jgi:hypothetical protein
MTTLKKLAAGLVAFTALTAVTSAPAANIYTYPDKPTDDGFYFVSVEGKIVPGDDAKFDKVLADKGVKDAIVWVNGPGGEMFAGLAIGRSVKRHNLSTFVPDKAMCVSMCALIWVAGFNRYYEDHARIGFHSMGDVYTDKRGQVVKKTASNGGNALVGGRERSAPCATSGSRWACGNSQAGEAWPSSKPTIQPMPHAISPLRRPSRLADPGQRLREHLRIDNLVCEHFGRRSLSRDVGRPDHPGPLFCVVGYKLFEGGW